MESDERQMLEHILKLSEDTNRMMRRTRREIRFGRFFRVLYWIVILAVGIAIYYFIKPYLSSLTSAAQSLGQLQSKISSF